MKNSSKRVLFIAITIFLFFAIAMAQNIINKLGGTGENDEFQVMNSAGDIKFVVQGDGKVGIGTTSPGYELDVIGDIRCTGNIYQNGTSFGQHYIGELYGGGIVFYIYDNGQHGLIASLNDLDGSSGVQWYNGSEITTNAESTWDGATNTTTIVSVQGVGTYAAQLCDDYTGGGQSDWYLPAVWEFQILFNNAFVISKILENDGDSTTNGLQFKNGRYWSSNEVGFSTAYNFIVSINKVEAAMKFSQYKVRAIRAF